MHRGRAVATLIAVLLLAACGSSGSSPKAPKPESDSRIAFAGDDRIPIDDAIYNITGQVVADVSSLTRQVKPGGGTISAPTCFGTSGCYGGGGGSFFGPTESGKGYIRLMVQSSKPASDMAREGTVVILKSTDTKGTALLPGDIVTFRCRRQYEAVAPVQENVKLDAKRDETWEWDFCRLMLPVVEVAKP